MPGVTEDPVDGGHGGDGGRVTDPPGQQLLSDLPGEHAGVVRLDPDDSLHHAGRRHLLKHQTRSDLKVIPLVQWGNFLTFTILMDLSFNG